MEPLPEAKQAVSARLNANRDDRSQCAAGALPIGINLSELGPFRLEY